MSTRRLRTIVVLVVAVATMGGAVPANAQVDQTAPAIRRVLTGTPGLSGWFVSEVNIRWEVNDPESPWVTSGCDARTLGNNTAGTRLECRAESAGGTSVDGVTIRIDAIAPTVTGTINRPPDVNGWYNQHFEVAFTGEDGLSGVASCSHLAYAGPDSRSTSLAGTCQDVAGNVSAPLPFGFRYDGTGPAIRSRRFSRRADHGGWYDHPVRVRFRARDGMSGGARCTPVTYGGPDATFAYVRAVCTDRAGNTSARYYRLRYDSTAPSLRLRGVPGSTIAVLRWAGGIGARRYTLTRETVGAAGTRRVVYRGRRLRFTDRRLVNGARYRYRLTTSDAAGNRTTRRVRLRPGRRLLSPRSQAQVSAPPLLRWSPIPGVRYFNVQLFRGRKRVLAAWPRRARYQLSPSWTYGGVPQQLTPGRYTWWVWPGRGAPRDRRYGRPIGRRSFIVPEA